MLMKLQVFDCLQFLLHCFCGYKIIWPRMWIDYRSIHGYPPTILKLNQKLWKSFKNLPIHLQQPKDNQTIQLLSMYLSILRTLSALNCLLGLFAWIICFLPPHPCKYMVYTRSIIMKLMLHFFFAMYFLFSFWNFIAFLQPSARKSIFFF